MKVYTEGLPRGTVLCASITPERVVEHVKERE